MNSWYVEYLLRNREQIRSNIVKTLDTFPEPGYEVYLENDNYNNLLLVEKTLKELLKNNQLSEKECIIINHSGYVESSSSIGRQLHMSRSTVSKIFSNVCDRVAFILGYEFTNEGYLDYLAEKYNLSDDKLHKIKEFMLSNKRHVIVRRKNIEHY